MRISISLHFTLAPVIVRKTSSLSVSTALLELALCPVFCYLDLRDWSYISCQRFDVACIMIIVLALHRGTDNFGEKKCGRRLTK